jgi:Protein of unknown function (DUF4239)
MWLIDYPSLVFLLLFVLFAISLEIGFRLGSLRNANEDADLHEQAVGVRDGVVVLLSLLLGFTLAMALPRFDQRRELIVDEANAIGTTTLRAQTLPEPARTISLELLREYVGARIDFSENASSVEKHSVAMERTHQIQASLWQVAAEAAEKNPTPVTSIYITSLNEMIDLDSKRTAAVENRVPKPIWIMLFLMGILACLSFGFSLRRRFILSMLVAPLMISIVMALIADLDTPNRGFIRVSQESMRRLQPDMNSVAPRQP